MKKKYLIAVLALVFNLTVACIDLKIGGFTLKSKDVKSAYNIVEAGVEAAKTFTPSQEHYIGRSVAANLLAQYKPYDKGGLNVYLNTLGQFLATCSDRPETFGGYHFLAIESDELNAFAAPGGFILVTTGLIKSCTSEDQLAAVLAHEVSHVCHRHGIKSIDKSRLTNFGVVFMKEAASHLGSPEFASLVDSFSGIIDNVSQTLVNTGYSRAYEEEADISTVILLRRTGYDVKAAEDMLKHLESHHVEGGLGLTRTHPHPKDRLKSIEEELSKSHPGYVVSLARNKRFRDQMLKSGLK